MSDDWGLMENWDEVPVCQHCEQELDWERCDQCDYGAIDAYESDPIWYEPGDTERCDQCDGAGGWYRCFNRQCPAKAPRAALDAREG